MKELTVAILMQINSFCGGFLIEIPYCQNEIIQCYMDDIYTLQQCKTEFITDEYGGDYE